MAVTERGSASLRVVGGGESRPPAAGVGPQRPRPTGARALRPAIAPKRSGKSGPDRLTVILVSLAMFLGLVALLANQVRASARPTPHVALVRRVYVTRIVQTVPGRGSGTSVSVATSGSAYPAVAAPTTRSSGG